MGPSRHPDPPRQGPASRVHGGWIATQLHRYGITFGTNNRKGLSIKFKQAVAKVVARKKHDSLCVNLADFIERLYSELRILPDAPERLRRDGTWCKSPCSWRASKVKSTPDGERMPRKRVNVALAEASERPRSSMTRPARSYDELAPNRYPKPARGSPCGCGTLVGIPRRGLKLHGTGPHPGTVMK
jgi:hypothetical protein